MKCLCGKRMKRNGGTYECSPWDNGGKSCPRFVCHGHEDEEDGRYYLVKIDWKEFRELDLGFALAAINEVAI